MNTIQNILREFNEHCRDVYKDYPYGYCNIAARQLKEILERERELKRNFDIHILMNE